jgi:hypothetical protein
VPGRHPLQCHRMGTGREQNSGTRRVGARALAEPVYPTLEGSENRDGKADLAEPRLRNFVLRATHAILTAEPPKYLR